MQPISFDEQGTPRFQQNAVVRWLVDEAKKKGLTLNDFPVGELPQTDVEQFWQMMGYSVGGYCELSFVSDESCEAAIAETKRLGFPWQQGSEAVEAWKKEHGYIK